MLQIMLICVFAKEVIAMDKITRMLLLYSKLIRGESVNKAVFCIETESSERSFDRDIEDIRLFLSEIYSVDEVVYDRANNHYNLSGITRKELEITEYRFLERLLLQAGVLRKDELEGVLSILASNTTRYRECMRSIHDKIETYNNAECKPLLKMHEDISQMIIDRRAIRIKYLDETNTIKEYKIVPFDIEIMNYRLYLLTVQKENAEYLQKNFLIDRIESFTPEEIISEEKWKKLVTIIKKISNK